MNSRSEVTATRNSSPDLKGEASTREHWRDWGDSLRRNKLDGLVAWLLDAGRPLSLISAQLLYIGSPLLGAGLERLAGLLESDEETAAFARFLDSDSNFEPRLAGGPR